MAAFPCTIPALPPSAMTWPANLLVAHDTLSDLYQHVLQAWNQEDADPLHLNFHLGSLEGNAMQLLGAIEGDPIGTRLSHWLPQTAKLFGKLYLAIAGYRDSIRNQ